jgi:hypothetical protein
LSKEAPLIGGSSRSEPVKREAQAKQKTEEEEKIKRAFDELEL